MLTDARAQIVEAVRLFHTHSLETGAWHGLSWGSLLALLDECERESFLTGARAALDASMDHIDHMGREAWRDITPEALWQEHLKQEKTDE